ncbi:hypothetical protein [Cesiribacter sp. SM1]|uniref:hypothetical protein n=1 Tax=Cesiribacter sp. SM1 TaxID=2861196 RepID=UPI001CD50C97|nr:hypothetical protein [Cesiribacter sp. SM1]
MELDDFKSDYKNAGNDVLGKDAIQHFMRGSYHPVLRKISIQLMVESMLWAIFLAVYYDFFDGHLKSPLWNILLILAVLLILLHNLLGFQLIRKPAWDENIMSSMENYLRQIRRYAWISIISRVVAIVVIIGYFVSSIQLTADKYWGLLLLLPLILVQIYVLYRVWAKRIRKVKAVYLQLKREG